MHNHIKRRVGIDKANCETCAYLGTEGDGNEPEFEVSWPVCDKFRQYEYLKSFPFKKEMICWRPNIWLSKQMDFMKYGTSDEDFYIIEAFIAARDGKERRYQHMWT